MEDVLGVPAGNLATEIGGCPVASPATEARLRRRMALARFLWPFLRRRIPRPEAVAAYAREQTSFYGRFYEGYDTDDFTSLPLLRKRVVREVSPYDLLARDARDKVILYGETTGSTGSPTPSFMTARELRAATLLAYLNPYLPQLLGAFRDNRTCMNGLAYGFTFAGPTFEYILRELGAMVAIVGSRSTLATPERIARAIVRLKPALITAAPTDFLSWMRIVEEDYPEDYPQVVDRLKVLMSTAELCSRERQRRVEEHFGITHINVYACVEGFFNMPCPCGDIHILPAYHVELFDPDLRPIGEYGTGRLAFTSLVKKSSPLVRYLLDDWVTIRKADCPHGFEKSVRPHGRFEMNVEVGGQVLNLDHFEDELFRHGLFGGYLVTLRDSGAEVTVERYARTPEGVGERIARGFKDRFGLDVVVKEVDFGQVTRYREVRRAKPLERLVDARTGSAQVIPDLL